MAMRFCWAGFPMVVLDIDGAGVRALGADGIRYSVPYGEPIRVGPDQARRLLGPALLDGANHPYALTYQPAA
jgi:hypothetical protein